MQEDHDIEREAKTRIKISGEITASPASIIMLLDIAADPVHKPIRVGLAGHGRFQLDAF
jgi:hypothetical protein